MKVCCETFHNIFTILYYDFKNTIVMRITNAGIEFALPGNSPIRSMGSPGA